MKISLLAQEPRIFLLESIDAYDNSLFRNRQSRVACAPYGVLTIRQLLWRTDTKSSCRKTLLDFIAHNPKLYHFLHYVMHLEQGYRVELKKSGCVIYLGSKRTLSELLLAEGVALKRPYFSDEEFRYRFYHAQRSAKVNMRGIWSDEKLRSCIGEFFKQ